jgi:hypothetical protein
VNDPEINKTGTLNSSVLTVDTANDPPEGPHRQGPFVAIESILRIWRSEVRGKEAHVLTGLELLRAKHSLRHGAWYPFLYKAGLEPSTATRRMAMANQFIGFVKTGEFHFRPPFEAVEGDELEAIEIAETKPCKLHDFAELGQAQRDVRGFVKKGYHPAGLGGIMDVTLRDFEVLAGKMERACARDYENWTAIMRQEAKDKLQMISDRMLRLKQRIDEVSQLSPREQIADMKREQGTTMVGSRKGDERLIQAFQPARRVAGCVTWAGKAVEVV